MEGGDQPDGLCYRAFEELFAIRDQRCESGRMAYSIKVSMLEIYNEQVRDLLSERTASTPKSLDIRVTSTGSEVTGLQSYEVHTPAEVHDLMLRGNKNRATGGHSMNERSSRSHSTIRISIMGENLDKGTMVNAKLYLIDLAGSERVSKTDATGDRLKEAQNINKSLSALGNVMQALGKASKDKEGKASHVPFRDSKLTYLLQDSLTGGSKVLMFVNVSPAAYNQPETLSSLGFASRCRAIELGKAHKNEESGEALAQKKEVVQLRKDLAKAQKSLEEKQEALMAAERREMALSSKLSESVNSSSKRSADQEAQAAQHAARLETMMNEREKNLAELARLESDLEFANTSVEAKEEDVVAIQAEVTSLHAELTAAREAKVAAEGSAMGLGIELKTVQRLLEAEKEKAAKSEGSVVAGLNSKLAHAREREASLQHDLEAKGVELAELKNLVAAKETAMQDLKGELARGRAEYSTLLTRVTMQKYGGGGGGGEDDDGGDVRGPSRGRAGTQSLPRGGVGGGGEGGSGGPTGVTVDRPLLTLEALAKARSHGGRSRLPVLTPAGAEGAGGGGGLKLYAPLDFVDFSESALSVPIPMSEAGAAAAARQKSQSRGNVLGDGGDEDDEDGDRLGGGGGDGRERVPSRGASLSRGDDSTIKGLEERRKQLALLSAMARDEEDDRDGPVPRDDDDEDEDLRASRVSSANSDEADAAPRSHSSASARLAAKANPAGDRAAAAAEAALVESLTGEDEATDAEFAGFQAAFVGGMTLVQVTAPSVGKVRRKARNFTIRFLPKKGLTLCWNKRDAVVLASISEVALGGAAGAADGPGDKAGSPRATLGVSFRTSFRASKGGGDDGSSVEGDLLCFTLRYRVSPGLTPTVAAGSPRLSREQSSPLEGPQASVVLEAETPEKRNHLARCFRRLANQERERSSFLLED